MVEWKMEATAALLSHFPKYLLGQAASGSGYLTLILLMV